MRVKLKSLRSSSEILRGIEKLVIEKDLSYIDAAIHYAEKNNMEVETVANIIKMSTVVKAQIQIEAESLNFLPKQAHLPI
jgi:Rad3-related DNA helicase